LEILEINSCGQNLFFSSNQIMFLQKRKLDEDDSNINFKKQKVEKKEQNHIKFITPTKKNIPKENSRKKIIDDDTDEEELEKKILEKKKAQTENLEKKEAKTEIPEEERNLDQEIVDLTLESPIKRNSHLKVDFFEKKLLESINSYLKSRIPHEGRTKKPLIETLRCHLKELSEILEHDNLFMISKSIFTQGFFILFLIQSSDHFGKLFANFDEIKSFS
jgi:hypothetical protein